MRYSVALLGTVSLLPAALAGRGNGPYVEPTQCNNVPDEAATVSGPTPTCYYAADPDGSIGYCEDLSYGGWCNCGRDGNFPNLEGGMPCAYTSLPASTLELSSTNCKTSTKELTSTVTVSPLPATKRAVETPLSGSTAERRRRANRLSKRGGKVSYAPSCNDPPPESSGYFNKKDFGTKKAVLEAAYADAVKLAKKAQSVAANSKGFTHYFGGEAADVQLKHFKAMMKGVASDEDNYDIRFVCGPKETTDCATGRRGSIMVTDATIDKGTKDIQVCPSFWTGASTRYLLYDEKKTEPTPPYRKKEEWCKKDGNNSDRSCQFFATAGTTVLHELTHLDSLAAKAGLDADDSEDPEKKGQHGTEDLPGCELQGARDWLKKYKEDSEKDSPDYNAESYAAAATEIYFMDLCGFTEIKPVVK